MEKIKELTFWDKNAWPIGLVVALLLFFSMTGYFVSVAFGERVDLVADDYYYRDKEFSARLEREKKLIALGGGSITRAHDGVSIELPTFFQNKKSTGTLFVYSPLNPADDFSVPVSFEGRNATFKLPLDVKHRWRLSLDFTANEKGYYLTSTLNASL
ncbi:MAG TPA: FixH family protein [Turneriella sp.]|nr:FixH family protein [Turneriella sp.]